MCCCSPIQCLKTTFSIYRKVVRGQSASLADALHIHQLIYRRIVREVFHDDEARRMLMRNNRTSPYLWGFAIFTVVPAALFWQSTWALMACCVVFTAGYVWTYISIIRFRVPRWLRRGASTRFSSSPSRRPGQGRLGHPVGTAASAS
jgi:UDP-GlcNAc:undecaprenyl-phosphate GlcNAc-1-phosphate transferase